MISRTGTADLDHPRSNPNYDLKTCTDPGPNLNTGAKRTIHVDSYNENAERYIQYDKKKKWLARTQEKIKQVRIPS